MKDSLRLHRSARPQRCSKWSFTALMLCGATAMLGACAPATIVQGGVAPVTQAELNWTALPPISDWTMRVTAARAMTDSSARADSLLVLARQALDGTGMKVVVAGTSSPTIIVPEDYRPVPVLNFDANLNQKTSRKFTEQTQTRSLKNDAGYYFTNNLVPFVVLGPLSIDPKDPDFLRMYTEHELYHAHHHVGDHHPLADRELETWTMQFRHWFYKLRQYRQRWGPLVQYYEKSTPEAQKVALAQLTDYYRNPPSDLVPAEQVADEQREFAAWLGRRALDKNTGSSKLVQDLQAQLKLSN